MPSQKPSKAQVKELATKNLDVVLDAIKNGTKIVEQQFWNKTEYGVKYPEGGYFRITKTIYDKIDKQINK